ncbi:MAG TPA: nucleotide exchange factor GrpE [Gammaproteobacteria bacterium]|nr:nucleotide exchange factor GrpE [Gammaproteobacteria bacterium]
MSSHDESVLSENTKKDESELSEHTEKAERGNTSSTETPENLSDLLEEARRKAAENWDLFLRTRADTDNIRRRATIDVENAHKYGVEKLARELLAVVDSLDHGLAAADAGGHTLKEGMELTYKLLLDTLTKFGILAINPVNEPFDPMKHEALTAQIKNDVEPNTVLIVVQKGFTLQDRLLRPARVIVSKLEVSGT